MFTLLSPKEWPLFPALRHSSLQTWVSERKKAENKTTEKIASIIDKVIDNFPLQTEHVVSGVSGTQAARSNF